METTERKEHEAGEHSLEWVEYLGKACDAFFREITRVVPEETSDHLRNSRKEFLMAIRSVLDRRIEHLEKRGPRKPNKVEVQ